MTEATAGRFFAIGVGPGDPELLTLKAVRRIQQADVIYHAGPEPDRGRALQTVRSLLHAEQPRRIVLRTGMSDVKPHEWKRYYRAGVDEIAVDCRAGRNVVFITEGDPTLYSTASYVWLLLGELHPGIPIEVVPGVSSVTAAAARVQWSLALRDEPLLILPGSYHADRLAACLTEFPSICLMKPAKVLPQIAETLHGRAEVVYVEEVGGADERITHDLNEAIDRHNYFSLVLLRTRNEQRDHLTRNASRIAPPRAAFGVNPSCKLHVVGIGPGDPSLLTQQAAQVLRQAEVIIGYEGYLRMLEPLRLRAELIGHPIGAEAERARQSLDLARKGRRVVLVSSGDAGVYGMASLLLESAEPMPDVTVEIIPGITAAVAASALLGAPLGHDFACISLSDLLTPWEVIAGRLDAAARGDFVVAIYNPISQRRTWQLPEARAILLRHRAPHTLVGLVDRAYRPGTRIWQTTLGELTTDGIGMETVLLIGNSQTRMVQQRMVTPRGYIPTQVSGDFLPSPLGGEESGVRGDRFAKPTPSPLTPLPRRGEGNQFFLPSPLGGEGSGVRGDRFAKPAPSPLTPLPRRGEGNRMGAPLGSEIMQESFAIIQRELGQVALPPWAFAVVRRMIHATADFEFAKLLRFSTDFEQTVQRAIAENAPVVTDTEMVLVGIRTALADMPDIRLACYLNDPETRTLAESAGITRSAAGMRIAAKQHASPLLVIGNAPTALEEAIRLMQEESWRPAAIIGMPVGFVGVEEAKGRLLSQSLVPYLTCAGRKGGSAVAAAAFNALLEHLLT